jgi:hypothetical protein
MPHHHPQPTTTSNPALQASPVDRPQSSRWP